MLQIKNQNTIELIKREYLISQTPWYMGFSGGKDSSALLTLLFLALQELDQRHKRVNVIYCDTGVDIPIVREQAISTLRNLEQEARNKNLPIDIKIVKPELKDTFFVKVIGRGYPPPTNIFRWCTRRLRIAPIQKIISPNDGKTNVVLLGIRNGESHERDRVISRHATEKKYYFKHSHSNNSMIFSPIIDYDTEEVWATIIDNFQPTSIDAKSLMKIYRDAAGECPVIRDPKGAACGKSRFGCWTCTVVRKDKAVTSMVNEGYDNLVPLLEFRNWLVEIRDNPKYRCHTRRNGAEGLGPINLWARKQILEKLLETQNSSNYELISNDELMAIQELWLKDLNSPIYIRKCENGRQYSEKKFRVSVS